MYILKLITITPMISSFFRKNGATGTNRTMQASPTISPQPLGLKTVAPDYDDRGLDRLRRPHRVDRSRRIVSTRTSSSTVPPPAGDLAAAVVVEEELEPDSKDNACWASYGRGHYRKFPPPMPLLARTARLSCRMPWVLARSHRADGSLVLREVRVRRHEYFRVRRGGGRLTLELVELDENSPLFRGGSGTAEGVVHSQPYCKVECDGSTVAKSTTSEESSSTTTTEPSSSPLREPALAIRTRACAAAGCPMSPLHSPMSRMRAVHVRVASNS